jgi:hypothetical protein
MPYFKNCNTLFIHIPKTGGTSLEEYLVNKCNNGIFAEDSEILFSNNGNTSYKNIVNFDHTLQHLTYLEIKSINKYLQIDFIHACLYLVYFWLSSQLRGYPLWSLR